MSKPETVAPVPASVPRLIGVVNITEDSFSDGGRYLAPADALAHARQLGADGADIIELGPAASHPGATPVTAAEQQRRLFPVLDQLAADGIPVSVDTLNPQVQLFTVARGAAYLNDIQGFPNPGFYPALAASGCRLIVMHSVQPAGPATKVVTDPAGIWASIEEFFTERLAALQAGGIGRDRLIIDPGLGYFLGSNPEPSLAVLARIRQLKETFGIPVLVSPSRKSFLRAVTGQDIAHVAAASLAAEIFAAWQGADYIRTHDVAAVRDALTVLDALTRHTERGRNAGTQEPTDAQLPPSSSQAKQCRA